MRPWSESVQRGVDAAVTVLGDTVNVASRLQALAEPDTVFLSEATHRLVQGMVEASFAGEHQIKGKSEPQKVYRLDAIRHGATRFEAAVSRGLSAFVGRERELEIVRKRFRPGTLGTPRYRYRGRAGHGQVAPPARVPPTHRQ